MAVDFFLKLDGIKGESKDHKHKDEIDVMSWSWGASQSGTMAFGGGGGAGKVAFNDFHFTMRQNKATPHLILHTCNGKHIPNGLFTARKAGEKQQEFLKIKFNDILVSSYQTSGSPGGDEVPIESISLNFTKVFVEYCEQKPDGGLEAPIPAGWDLKKNEKI